MKIDNNSLKSIVGGPNLEETGRPAKKSASEPATVVSDTVELSTVSSSLQAIERGFAETPVVDTARVDEIKQAIANGHFKVNADKVADRLLQTVQDLLQAHKA
jgi:negative regulator of flagellin synthesis FlgM